MIAASAQEPRVQIYLPRRGQLFLPGTEAPQLLIARSLAAAVASAGPAEAAPAPGPPTYPRNIPALLREYRPVELGPPAPATAPPLPFVARAALDEPLTAREAEVLALLAAGLSNREIGARLHLTPGSVKWHAHNLYGKLGVGRRTQAVARARALGLLDG
jgi:DNA-binding CsgD family transcriptional regulator